jgi:PKD repeat protein
MCLVFTVLSVGSSNEGQAAVHNPIPANQFGDPTQDLLDTDALFAYFTSDIAGGSICIVPWTVEDASGFACDQGEEETIIGGVVGTGYILITATPPVGTFRLLSTDAAGNGIGLSVPFTVSPCPDCPRSVTDSIVAEWKNAAVATYTATHTGCMGFKLKELADSLAGIPAGFVAARAKIADAAQRASAFLAGEETMLAYVLIGAGGSAIPALGFALPTPQSVIGTGQDKALDLLAFVTCSAAAMYEGIIADPPDPNFEAISEPVFATAIDSIGSAVGDALMSALDRTHAFGDASRIAFERYQGAAEADDLQWQIDQLNAAAFYTRDLVAEIGASIGALRDHAGELAPLPTYDQPVITQEDLDLLTEIYQRVQSSGFTPEETQALVDLGLTAEEIGFVATHFNVDLSQMPPGVTLPDMMTQAANGLEAQIPVYEAFARELEVVAARLGLGLGDPVAGFTFAPSNPLNGQAINFTDTSTDDGSIVAWSWDFGDGNTATVQNPDHAFDAPGEYTVILTVTDDEGRTNEAVMVVNVLVDPDPIASFTATPGDSTVGQPIQFDASGSVDYDGTITSYDWDFGDGNTGWGVNPSHAYSEVGSYTVILTVTDDEGRTNEAVMVVNVLVDPDPIASFTATPGDSTVGQPIQFDASGSVDYDGTITSYEWDFGDGNTGSGVNPSHAYSEVGSYTVILTVTDNDGRTGAVSEVVSASAPLGPEATDDVMYARPETLTKLFVMDNDFHPDGEPLTITGWTQGSNGEVNCLANGVCEYTGASGFSGADSFTYTIADPDGNEATATVVVRVDLDVDLVVFTSVDAGPDAAAHVGEEVTFNVLVRNLGTTVSPSTHLLYEVGDSMQISGIETDVGTCDGDSVVQCDLGDLAPDEQAIVTIRGSGPTLGEYSHTATVSSDIEDLKPEDNTATLDFSIYSTEPNIRFFETIRDADFQSAGVGGMRGSGSGQIELDGVSGQVTRALLYWQGPTNSDDPEANAVVSFNGEGIVGEFIGISDDNCWSFANSRAYRADVTALVSGDGTYQLDGFTKSDADINGASLLVFFDDGDGGNDRDVVIFDGNDSNILNIYDADGWDVELAGIRYTSGSAGVELHASDGQTFGDDALVINGTVVLPAGGVFDGNTVPGELDLDGLLWDITAIDVTELLSPGVNSLDVQTGIGGDCISLVVAAVDLPAGAAPSDPGNDLPVGLGDSYKTDEDTELVVPAPGVLGNDSDADGDNLTAGSFAQPAGGSAMGEADGSFTYTPNADFCGDDSFTYMVSDGVGEAGPVTVDIAVACSNDPPIANDDRYIADEDATLIVDGPGVLTNDIDVDGDRVAVDSHQDASNGVVTVNSDGSFDYTPTSGFCGVDGFSYQATDGNDLAEEADVSLEVRCANDPPVGVEDSLSGLEDQSISLETPGVLANDTDSDGDDLMVDSYTQPSGGSVVVGADGSVDFTPNANFCGIDSFTYDLSDQTDVSGPVAVTVEVACEHDPPVAVDDSYSTDEDATLTIPAPGLLANDSDIDGDSLMVDSYIEPDHGTLTLHDDGSFVYVPNRGFSGGDSFTYQASDGSSTEGATVTLTVRQAEQDDQVCKTRPPKHKWWWSWWDWWRWWLCWKWWHFWRWF